MKNADLYAEFLRTPLTERLERHRHTDCAQSYLAWAKKMARQVPAYAAFIANASIDLDSFADDAEFSRLPLITKENYMRVYALPERCIDGQLSACETVAVSSGSTGTPLFWPRSLSHEIDIAARFEQIFVDSFQAHEKTTLAIICFALGTWVGGMFSAQSCRLLSQKGLPITVLTPGNIKAEILRVVTELGPHFDQTVLLGYPPFIKDVIDTGRANGVEWPRYAPKLVFAGEVFSEEWRDLVCERIGATDPRFATASLYGTADGGVLGNETPLSIHIRRLLARRPALAAELFGESRLPTLVQYDPCSRFFEVHDHTLVVSGDNGVPLIRYHIADKGGFLSFQALTDFMRQHGEDPIADLKVFASLAIHDLPFVYIFGRADFTVSYFGANVYPENISVGLEQSEVCDWVTGKFVLDVIESSDLDKRLQVVVELAPGQAASPQRRDVVASVIQRELLRLNSEFANYVPAQARAIEVILLAHGDAQYFPIGVKHRYTRRKTPS